MELQRGRREDRPSFGRPPAAESEHGPLGLHFFVVVERRFQVERVGQDSQESPESSQEESLPRLEPTVL